MDRRTLVEAELIDSVAWLIGLRWIAGGSVLLATWIVGAVFALGVPAAPLYIIGAGILLYNLTFYLVERHLRQAAASTQSYGLLAMGQVGLDWLAMTLLIHFSGGSESPAILFFIFHIIIASIFFPPRAAFAFALLAVALVSGTALLEFFGLLPHESINGFLPVPLYQNSLYVMAQLLFFASTSLIAAYLASTIQQRLRRREDEIVALGESLQRATSRLQALNEGARVVDSTLNLPEVLNRLVTSTAQAMKVRACAIQLADQNTGQLETVAFYGLNVSHDPKREGIQSVLSTPLIGKSGTLGMLRAYALEPNRFTPDDESFLTAIAAQGSIAIENAIAYETVEALDAAKSQFVRMVTHELRSPVSVARSLLRTLSGGYVGALSEQQHDILNRTTRRLAFLQKLIDDLLDLAAGKIDVKGPIDGSPIVLGEVVRRVITRFEVTAREKGVALDYQCDATGDSMVVMATPDALDRIFDNLISNALKYTPTGGRVQVRLAHIDHEVRATVEDTGLGIPEEALAHLFEEFYRAANAKAVESEGTGLGLTIVKDLVTRLRGRVHVQSLLGVGSQFTVVLPAQDNC